MEGGGESNGNKKQIYSPETSCTYHESSENMLVGCVPETCQHFMEVGFLSYEFLNIVGWQKPNLNVINKIHIHVSAAKTRNS
jgi:hypothetical protein